MDILVLAPYEEKLIKALADAVNVKESEFILVGNRKTIIELFFKNKLSYMKFKIIEAVTDMEIVEEGKRILKTKDISYIIFGNINSYFQKKVLGIDNNKEMKTINVIDIPQIRYFLFLGNITENVSIDFEIKKQTILLAESVMKNLDIKKINVGMISSGNNKADILETKIIRMLFHDNNLDHINVFEVGSINNLFSKDTKFNIHKININLLVMRNYDSSRIFIDTLKTFSTVKIASLIIDHINAIDISKCADYDDVLFSILIMNKLSKNCHINKVQKVVNLN